MTVKSKIIDIPNTLEEFDEALLHAVEYMHSHDIDFYWQIWQETQPRDWAEFLNWIIEEEA